MRYASKKSYGKRWKKCLLERRLSDIYGIKIGYESKQGTIENLARINKDMLLAVRNKRKKFGKVIFDDIIKKSFLYNIDLLWKEHLHLLEHIKSGINLRAYGQKEPLSEYKLEAFDMFEAMLIELEERIVKQMYEL